MQNNSVGNGFLNIIKILKRQVRMLKHDPKRQKERQEFLNLVKEMYRQSFLNQLKKD